MSKGRKHQKKGKKSKPRTSPNAGEFGRLYTPRDAWVAGSAKVDGGNAYRDPMKRDYEDNAEDE